MFTVQFMPRMRLISKNDGSAAVYTFILEGPLGKEAQDLLAGVDVESREPNTKLLVKIKNRPSVLANWAEYGPTSGTPGIINNATSDTGLISGYLLANTYGPCHDLLMVVVEISAYAGVTTQVGMTAAGWLSAKPY